MKVLMCAYILTEVIRQDSFLIIVLQRGCERHHATLISGLGLIKLHKLCSMMGIIHKIYGIDHKIEKNACERGFS